MEKKGFKIALRFMIWVSMYMLAPDRENHLEHGKLNLLTRREVVTSHFSELLFPMDF